MAAQEQISISRPAPYLEAAGQTYLDLLTQKTGQAPTAAEIQGMSPQVAGQNVLTQQAQQQAASQAGLGALQFDPTTGAVIGAGQGTGVAGYQPFLNQAQQYSGPQAYQQFMSPYQQDVINTTLSEYDRQRQIQQQGIASQAIQAGAFGGGREGVQQAEFGAQSLQNRAALQAQLLQQGYQSAQQAAGTAFSQQQSLAALQPTLATTGIQQLGAAGTSNLAYQQAVLDAQRQAAQFAYQEPYQRLSVLGSGITGLLAGQPQAPYSQQVTPLGGAGQGASPLSQALQSAATVYGLGSLFGK
jgi:hypothetical protein